MSGILLFTLLVSLPDIIEEIRFRNAPMMTVDAQLLEQKCTTTPLSKIFGCSTSYMTVWDCGEHGKVKSDLKKVWTHASEHATLLIKKCEDDVRIYGILKD